jgi:hypothetical protein
MGIRPPEGIPHLSIRSKSDAGGNNGVRLCEDGQTLPTHIFLVPVLLAHLLEAQVFVDPSG